MSEKETKETEESVKLSTDQAEDGTERESKLQSYASAHRMILYLLMALIVLELADIPSWATIPVFILYLWSDHGETIVGLQEKGWSNFKIVLRMFVDVLPIILVAGLAWVWSPAQAAVGIAALLALVFYLFNRHRLMRYSVSAE